MKKLSIGLALLFVFTLTFSATMTFTENAVAADCQCCIIMCPSHPSVRCNGTFTGGNCVCIPCTSGPITCDGIWQICPE